MTRGSSRFVIDSPKQLARSQGSYPQTYQQRRKSSIEFAYLVARRLLLRGLAPDVVAYKVLLPLPAVAQLRKAMMEAKHLDKRGTLQSQIELSATPSQRLTPDLGGKEEIEGAGTVIFSREMVLV